MAAAASSSSGGSRVCSVRGALTVVVIAGMVTTWVLMAELIQGLQVRTVTRVVAGLHSRSCVAARLLASLLL
jgi:hypothetical protein